MLNRLLILMLLILQIASCKTKMGETVPEGMVKAEVIDYPLDGCKWMLLLESGERLEPLNLEKEFQQDKLSVNVSYALEKEAVSICMSGKIVTILQIRRR